MKKFGLLFVLTYLVSHVVSYLYFSKRGKSTAVYIYDERKNSIDFDHYEEA